MDLEPPKDVENKIPSFCQNLNDPQVKLHPHLVGDIADVLGLIIEAFASTQNLLELGKVSPFGILAFLPYQAKFGLEILILPPSRIREGLDLTQTPTLERPYHLLPYKYFKNPQTIKTYLHPNPTNQNLVSYSYHPYLTHISKNHKLSKHTCISALPTKIWP